jgi:hypothetical protein
MNKTNTRPHIVQVNQNHSASADSEEEDSGKRQPYSKPTFIIMTNVTFTNTEDVKIEEYCAHEQCRALKSDCDRHNLSGCVKRITAKIDFKDKNGHQFQVSSVDSCEKLMGDTPENLEKRTTEEWDIYGGTETCTPFTTLRSDVQTDSRVDIAYCCSTS